MQRRVSDFVKLAALAAIVLLAAACADQPQKQSQQQAPVVANAAQTASPAIAVPDPVGAPPVPAYGPSPHPNYYYPPVGGVALPGPSMH